MNGDAIVSIREIVQRLDLGVGKGEMTGSSIWGI